MKKEYKKLFQIDGRTVDLVCLAEKKAKDEMKQAEEIAEYNQLKVLQAFQKNKISETHFIGSTGYGYDDAGRETLDRLYADIFGAEDALVRHNIISGTHALSLCLFGVLRPGDTLLAATGKPYDTLEETIGIRGEGNGSLKDFGISYRQVDLRDNKPDIDGILNCLDESVKAVIIQRSKGYDFRKSLSVEEIGDIVTAVKRKKQDVIVIVDNCYGEFVDVIEPTQVGADLMAGSLIKNPGGSLALTGGYIAGKREYVELCSYKLNAVGIGKECGATFDLNRSMFQGIYLAPHIVCQAVKTAVLAAYVFAELGFQTSPAIGEKRSCIIEAIRFGDPRLVVAFCQGIQKGAAIDSFVVPEPWDMPGYGDPVIMAAGAFVQGSSIELSADAPMKDPYVAYMQGGVTYTYGKMGVMLAVDNMIKQNLL
ncbi:methionine gamma-lyase family protein [Acetivibrio sp. MSJd-27]|uniref:methionine gamma-lyase family protein n=1 Tax=Acetivibrio sp. MSJd-27 TaxID=2841523 RepID=UPI001C113748|nr:methionine gamma-lyase family protein [Acetivibrio sp. MSJd-27]MBU5448987.1 methionine gamma-lyase family protein [Acetivibrio sp. MSJd-27]